jgi:hypothetical protein
MTALAGANGRHGRFRELAATALDFPLTAAEATELAAHLATCPACTRLAAGLRADAGLLRQPAELATSYWLDTAVGAAIAGRRPAGQASRTLLLVAATLLLVAALLGAAAVGAYLWRTMNPPLVVVPTPSPPVVVPSPDPSGEPGPAVPAFTWELGTIPPMAAGGGGESIPVAATVGYDDLVAVGARFFVDNDTPSGGFASAWSSHDGLAWTTRAADDLAVGDGIFIDDYPAPGLVDVAWGRPGVVAVGTSRIADREGGAWFSPDGANWFRADFADAARARPASVAWTKWGSFVAVGVVEDEGSPRGAAWTSDDGRSWERVPDGDAFDIGGYITLPSGYATGGPVDVAVLPDGSLVALSRTCTATADMEEQSVCRPFAMTSRDGTTWERDDLPGEASGGRGLEPAPRRPRPRRRPAGRGAGGRAGRRAARARDTAPGRPGRGRLDPRGAGPGSRRPRGTGHRDRPPGARTDPRRRLGGSAANGDVGLQPRGERRLRGRHGVRGRSGWPGRGRRPLGLVRPRPALPHVRLLAGAGAVTRGV